MALTRFAYVRSFELPDLLLPNTHLVVRLDGHSFHRFSEVHGFQKPNDERALQLMDRAAQSVMEEFPDVVLGFGESDEFSFLLRKSCSLFSRRSSKIVSTLTSLFTSSYVFHWPSHLPDTPLKYPPSFDGRIITYPGVQEVRDYFSWRQADTHINNLYNTSFWALVQQGGLSATEAHKELNGTVSGQKHELLFSRFGINYNTLPARFRKGTVLVREQVIGDVGGGGVGVPPMAVAVEAESEIDSPKGPTVVEEETLSAPNPLEVTPTESAPSTSPEATLPDLSSTPTPLEPEPLLSMPMPKPSTKLSSREKSLAKKQARKLAAASAPKYEIRVMHCDIIGDAFWAGREGTLLE